jgi:hypothetical protein
MWLTLASIELPENISLPELYRITRPPASSGDCSQLGVPDCSLSKVAFYAETEGECRSQVFTLIFNKMGKGMAEREGF